MASAPGAGEYRPEIYSCSHAVGMVAVLATISPSVTGGRGIHPTQEKVDMSRNWAIPAYRIQCR